jgi:hypothetical protein
VPESKWKPLVSNFLLELGVEAVVSAGFLGIGAAINDEGYIEAADGSGQWDLDGNTVGDTDFPVCPIDAGFHLIDAKTGEWITEEYLRVQYPALLPEEQMFYANGINATEFEQNQVGFAPMMGIATTISPAAVPGGPDIQCGRPIYVNVGGTPNGQSGIGSLFELPEGMFASAAGVCRKFTPGELLWMQQKRKKDLADEKAWVESHGCKKPKMGKCSQCK